jgi:hypothetical protein
MARHGRPDTDASPRRVMTSDLGPAALKPKAPPISSLANYCIHHGQLGAPGPIRTDDLRFRKPTLYPLSYGGLCLLAGLLCYALLTLVSSPGTGTRSPFPQNPYADITFCCTPLSFVPSRKVSLLPTRCDRAYGVKKKPVGAARS